MAHAVNFPRPVQNAFEDVLRLAVGAAGDDAFLLVDRDLLRLGKQRRGRGQDEALYIVLHHALDEIQAVADVVADVEERLAHRLPDLGA